MKRILYFLLPIFLLITNCKHEQEPCFGQQQTSASFKIEGVLTSWYTDPLIFEADTFSVNRFVRLSALDNSIDSCWWQIGSDTNLRREKSFQLYFEEPYGKIDITLAVKKKPNSNCFPFDNGWDTVTKSIYIIPYGSELYRGTYIGYEEHNPNQKYEVWIDTAADEYSDMLNELPPYHISNLNEGCIYTYSNNTRYSGYVINGWNYFSFYREYGKGGCGARLKGRGTYDPIAKKIVLDYSYSDPHNNPEGTKTIYRKFIGVKK